MTNEKLNVLMDTIRKILDNLDRINRLNKPTENDENWRLMSQQFLQATMRTAYAIVAACIGLWTFVEIPCKGQEVRRSFPLRALITYFYLHDDSELGGFSLPDLNEAEMTDLNNAMQEAIRNAQPDLDFYDIQLFCEGIGSAAGAKSTLFFVENGTTSDDALMPGKLLSKYEAVDRGYYGTVAHNGEIIVWDAYHNMCFGGFRPLGALFPFWTYEKELPEWSRDGLDDVISEALQKKFREGMEREGYRATCTGRENKGLPDDAIVGKILYRNEIYTWKYFLNPQYHVCDVVLEPEFTLNGLDCSAVSHLIYITLAQAMRFGYLGFFVMDYVFIPENDPNRLFLRERLFINGFTDT